MSIHTTIPDKVRDLKLRDDFRDYLTMIRNDLERILGGLPADTAQDAKDLRWLVRELEKTRKEFLSLEKRLSDEADADPKQHFDFDTIRDQIGGRLDNLRRSYSPTEVSE